MGEKKSKKRAREQQVKQQTVKPEPEVPATRRSDDGYDNNGEPIAKRTKWTNKTRTLVLAARGISHRGRHLMHDIQHMMPHSKTESKLSAKMTLYNINEMAEMKNCSKCLLFEGRKGKDLFLWVANIKNGPSIKFEVLNVHTMSELKMTGNCLTASRPMLSFDEGFNKSVHLKIIKELFIQAFGVPNHHPKSQPFVDKVFTFSVVDDKIWFRNYQIVEETGSLSEVGPRMVLDPIRLFDGAFCGETLWESARYVAPNVKRSMAKNPMKYRRRMEANAIYKATIPKEPGFKVDATEHG
jgi:ribosome biogenesis protein BRX1